MSQEEPKENFLEFVEKGQLLRHKPSGLTGRCVHKSSSAFIDGRNVNFGFFLNATIELPSGKQLTFTYPFLEVVDGGH